MMELDLDDFAAAVAAKESQWHDAGLRWEFHRGPTRSKSAAWVDCTTAYRLAQLIVWTSGEADLEVGDFATGAVTITHYEMSSAAELADCLDNLASQLTAPTDGS